MYNVLLNCFQNLSVGVNEGQKSRLAMKLGIEEKVDHTLVFVLSDLSKTTLFKIM